jgi:hypothetical protein
MNTVQSALNSPRVNRILFWLGAAVLAAGVVVLIVKLVPGSNGESTAASPSFKPQIAKPQAAAKTAAGQPITKYSQIDSQAKLAIRRFILGAVAGKDYAGSWPYVAPSIKKGYTLRKWVTARSHPVIPYPVYKFDKLSQFHLEYAHPNDIYATVSLTAPPKLKIRPTVFAIGLVKQKGTQHHWVVNYWMPRYTPGVFVGSEKQ